MTVVYYINHQLVIVGLVFKIKQVLILTVLKAKFHCTWLIDGTEGKIFLVIEWSIVKLGFKNRQNKNLLDFKNQITNYQLVIYVVNYSQDKNNLDFKNQNSSDRKSS